MENYKLLNNLWNIVLSAIFPPRCISCKTDGVYFCANCRRKIPQENTTFLPYIVSLWKYEHCFAQKAVRMLKYSGKKMLARDLAEALYDKILEGVAEDILYQNPISGMSERYVLIPIPISKKRKKKRGYNQAELLAGEIALLNKDCFVLETDILGKIKETPSQVSVRDRKKRLQNIRGSFAVKNPEKIAGKRIIIIDDVVTTGATITEARRVLLEAGAKYVIGATLAH